jgi:hypothetical protein
MGNRRALNGLFVEKPKGKRPLGTPTRRLDNNIKMCLKELYFNPLKPSGNYTYDQV